MDASTIAVERVSVKTMSSTELQCSSTKACRHTNLLNQATLASPKISSMEVSATPDASRGATQNLNGGFDLLRFCGMPETAHTALSSHLTGLASNGRRETGWTDFSPISSLGPDTIVTGKFPETASPVSQLSAHIGSAPLRSLYTSDATSPMSQISRSALLFHGSTKAFRGTVAPLDAGSPVSGPSQPAHMIPNCRRMSLIAVRFTIAPGDGNSPVSQVSLGDTMLPKSDNRSSTVAKRFTMAPDVTSPASRAATPHRTSARHATRNSAGSATALSSTVRDNTRAHLRSSTRAYRYTVAPAEEMSVASLSGLSGTRSPALGCRSSTAAFRCTVAPTSVQTPTGRSSLSTMRPRCVSTGSSAVPSRFISFAPDIDAQSDPLAARSCSVAAVRFTIAPSTVGSPVSRNGMSQHTGGPRVSQMTDGEICSDIFHQQPPSDKTSVAAHRGTVAMNDISTPLSELPSVWTFVPSTARGSMTAQRATIARDVTFMDPTFSLTVEDAEPAVEPTTPFSSGSLQIRNDFRSIRACAGSKVLDDAQSPLSRSVAELKQFHCIDSLNPSVVSSPTKSVARQAASLMARLGISSPMSRSETTSGPKGKESRFMALDKRSCGTFGILSETASNLTIQQE